MDPESNSLSRLYNPRTDHWEEHFSIEDHEINGRTPIGRATVKLLNMNAANLAELRRAREGDSIHGE